MTARLKLWLKTGLSLVCATFKIIKRTVSKVSKIYQLFLLCLEVEIEQLLGFVVEPSRISL